MTVPPDSGGPVVIDTGVFSALLPPRQSPLAEPYRRIIADQPIVVSFQTVTELRYGALRGGWGDLRRHCLERVIGDTTV